jgi:hypothetical protein
MWKRDIYGRQLESESRRNVASEPKCDKFKTVTNVRTMFPDYGLVCISLVKSGLDGLDGVENKGD